MGASPSQPVRVAQSGERRIPNPSGGGSSPPACASIGSPAHRRVDTRRVIESHPAGWLNGKGGALQLRITRVRFPPRSLVCRCWKVNGGLAAAPVANRMGRPARASVDRAHRLPLPPEVIDCGFRCLVSLPGGRAGRLVRRRPTDGRARFPGGVLLLDRGIWIEN